MSGAKSDLSGRYYIAEAAVWVLGGVLLISSFVKLEDSQPLPVLNIVLENSRYFPRIVSAILSASVLYLCVEWRQSLRKARRQYFFQIRYAATIFFVGISFWFSYPEIFSESELAVISPAWFLSFIVVGLILGSLVSVLIFVSFLIRKPEEARKLNLPRVPVTTRATFNMCAPAVILLTTIFFFLRNYSPEILTELWLGIVLTGVPFFLIVGLEIVPSFLSQDEDGKRVPFLKHIATIKGSVDAHDYFYFLNKHGDEAKEVFGVNPKNPPEVIQKTMQNKISVQMAGANSEDKKLVIPKDTLQKYANVYFHEDMKDPELEVRNFLSYAIDEFAKEKIIEEGGSLLYRAAAAGEENQLKEILQQEVDVNETVQAGWSALLIASAQGYPKIVSLLLNAGANPDLGNVHNITPLMYGARYGNLEVSMALIEHGANIDLQDIYGNTALIVATKNGSFEVVDELVSAGANTVLKDRDGQTALDHAHNLKQGNIAKKLRRANWK